jgi:predicted permease
MDWTVLAFTLGLAVLTTLLFGLAPLARAARIRPMVALRGGRHGKVGGRSVGANEALVVTEVALALALLVAAGLLVRSFASFHRWDPGFQREHLLTVSLTATTGAYESREAILNLYRTLDQELEALPGVESVARSSAGPLFGGWEPDRVLPEERAGEEGGIQARWYDVSPAYFETLGIPVVRGRGFTPDDGMDGPPVVVVNETLARLLWPGENPVGRKLRLEMHDATREVLGVVADVPPVDPDAPVEPEMFWPQAGYTRPVTFFVIRTEGDPTGLREVVVNRIQEVDPDLQTGIVRSFDDLMDRRLVEPRFNMLLITIFGGVALILAAVGIYGVVSRSVASRTREIGIRIALGAPRRRVLTNVVAGSMALTGIGVGVGLLVAFALSRFIAGLLHGVPPTDPATYSAVALGLIAVAFFASLLPALGASRVDPMTSLREE